MPAKWTFLVYMAANNSLGAYAESSIAKMATVDIDDSINVIVQVRGQDLQTKRYLVRNKQAQLLPWPPGSPPNPNMAAPGTLKDFIEWGLAGYGADRCALILWCHGGGLEDDVHSSPAAPGALIHGHNELVVYDGGSSLSVAELRQEIATATTKPLDLLGFDACLMGMIEIAYEMRLVARSMVASENLAPIQGWPYAEILTTLLADSTMEPEGLAETIVEAFEGWYNLANPNDVKYGAQAAIRLQVASDSPEDAVTIDGLAAAIGTFGGALLGLVSTASESIAAVRLAGRDTAMNKSDYLDLQALLDEIDGQGVAVTTEAVREALTGVLVSRCKVGAMAKYVNGLSIFFPQDASLLWSYDGMAFETTPWAHFLSKFLASPAGIGLMPQAHPPPDPHAGTI